MASNATAQQAPRLPAFRKRFRPEEAIHFGRHRAAIGEQRTMTNGQRAIEKGFFGSLFDFGFTQFITLKFIKVIYGIATVLIGLATLLWMVKLIDIGGGYIAVGLIGAPLFGLFYLIFTRIGLEVVAVLFRIGENTASLASRGTQSVIPPPASPPVF
jgi:hypothetical protein